ncbi:hypothetical protein CYMTET_42524 [Cymbomonas tetramitiformis]|uniref:MYND-type domain-containing protein n=1 Tax=Cymbomonas tetramitiformis TaxID=36881 RepID=A0AAE0C400_9CHLO|nr:hypothetical protein CYMTET_42524 [Cymbomonas tetramitiformis]
MQIAKPFLTRAGYNGCGFSEIRLRLWSRSGGGVSCCTFSPVCRLAGPAEVEAGIAPPPPPATLEEVKEAVLQVMEDLDISDPASLTRAATESATGGSSVPGSSGNPAAVTSSAKFPVTAMCSACGSPAGAAALLRCGQCKVHKYCSRACQGVRGPGHAISQARSVCPADNTDQPADDLSRFTGTPGRHEDILAKSGLLQRGARSLY